MAIIHQGLPHKQDHGHDLKASDLQVSESEGSDPGLADSRLTHPKRGLPGEGDPIAPPDPIRALRRVFYGWWIVLSCGLLQLLGAGFFYYGLGTFFLPLTNEFGWSRALTSSAFSLHRLEGGIIAPLVGFAFDRLGPRKLALFGVSTLGVGFILLSQASSFPGFVAAVLVMSAGYGCAFTANTMATVANWFVRKRTTALGLVMAGSGLGGLLVPVLAFLVDANGWRAAALAVGLAMLVVGIPLVLALRHSPESCGLLPDGERPARLLKRKGELLPRAQAQAFPVVVEVHVGVRQAVRTRAFWLLTLATSLSAIAQSALVVHAIPHLTGIGMAATLAASALGAMSVISVAGRIAFGWVGDRLPKRRVLAFALALQAAGLAVIAGASEPWHVLPFLALFAPGYGGAYPLRPSIQGEYFGRASFGAIQGVMLGVNAFAAMLAPVFAGYMYDTLGSYRLALWLITAIVACAVPAALAMPRPAKPRHSPALET